MVAEVMDNRPIVVGVNGSSAAARALRWAAREAVRRAVPLLIVHTCELIQAAVPHATAVRGYRDAVIEDGRTLLAEAAESCVGRQETTHAMACASKFFGKNSARSPHQRACRPRRRATLFLSFV